MNEPSALTREQVEEAIALTVGPQCDDSELACARLLAHDAAQRAHVAELEEQLNRPVLKTEWQKQQDQLAAVQQQLAEAMKEREAGEIRIASLRKYLAATLVERDRLMEALSDIEQFTNGYGDVAGIVHKMAREARQAPAPPAADTGERP